MTITKNILKTLNGTWVGITESHPEDTRKIAEIIAKNLQEEYTFNLKE